MVGAGSWSCSRWTDRCKNDLDLNCDICRETDPEIGKAAQRWRLASYHVAPLDVGVKDTGGVERSVELTDAVTGRCQWEL